MIGFINNTAPKFISVEISKKIYFPEKGKIYPLL